MSSEKLAGHVLREVFLNSLIVKPSKIKQFDLNWACKNWDINDWSSNFGSYKFKFRVCNKETLKQSPQWEGEAIHFEATLEQFLNWQKGSLEADNPFALYKKDDYWAYSSYNYLNEVFSQIDNPDPINWSELGFPDKTGNDSVLWVGTKGANTPCHQDSYGCNIVVQMTGRKLWILFPPDNTPNMYPTRIPYEESSVYSLVNILNPNLKKYPKFSTTTPYCTILEPGEILFVPHHWWHYVHNLETSISINMWIELPEDDECRLHEAVVKLLANSLIFNYEPSDENWLNPFEDLNSSEMALGFINQQLERLKTMECDNPKIDIEIPSIIKPLEAWEFCDLQQFLSTNVESSQVAEADEIHELKRKDIINTMLQPDVIALIAEKLKQAYQ